jgi:hypothetical protein
MANAIYPEYKEFLLAASANVSLDQNDSTNGPFIALVDTGTYTYSSGHDFYSDLSGIVGTDQRIANPTVANGTFDGDNVTYTAVSGNSVEALVIYRKNSGANTTWKVVAYIDTSVTGLPVTPNGGDITVTFNASGIFTISDRKKKHGIRLVGDYRGELGIYEYAYHGEERVRLGFMADEVEKLDKSAVVDFGSHKRVNYHRAFAAADRLAA